MPQGREMVPEADREAAVERLREVQRARGLSDEAMGQQLGLSREGWKAIRRGGRNMGLPAVYWAPRRFPEVIPHWLSFVLGVGQDSQRKGL